MLKGAQKRMIVIRTRDSRMFEEAYFVIRRDATENTADQADMLWEANRIIERSTSPIEPVPMTSPASLIPRRRRLLLSLFSFVVGVICGGGLIGILWYLL